MGPECKSIFTLKTLFKIQYFVSYIICFLNQYLPSQISRDLFHAMSVRLCAKFVFFMLLFFIYFLTKHGS